MRRTCLTAVLTVALSLPVVLLAVGCGDDKSTDSGGDTMSQQDQYDLIDMFVDLDVDGDASQEFDLSVLTLGLGLVNLQLLDGVDQSDLGNLFVPGLPRRVASDPRQAIVSLSYNDVDGWWVLEIDSALTEDGLSRTVHFRDSIRFETLDNVAQMIPDAATATYIERAQLTVDVAGPYDGGDLDASLQIESSATLSGLTTTTAVLNSSCTGSFDVFYELGESMYDLGLSFTGMTANITAPNFETGGCPNSGSLIATLEVDAEAHDGENHLEAHSLWNVSAQIQEGGVVQVNVQSGSFSESGTTLICGN